MSEFLGPAWGPDGEPLLVAQITRRVRARHRQRTRVVVDDFGNAVCYQRRCTACRRWLPLSFDHFHPHSRGGISMGTDCIRCKPVVRRIHRRNNLESTRARQRERYRAWKERDPVAYAKWREGVAERAHQRRERDPDGERARDREATARSRERIYADPQRREEYLEKARIDGKLRRLDAGKVLRGGRIDVRGGAMGVLPSAPLVAAVDEWLDGRPEHAAAAFIDPRNLSGWRTGEYATTQFDVADRALIGIDLLWWEVWPEGVDGHERAAELFAGEKVAA